MPRLRWRPATTKELHAPADLVFAARPAFVKVQRGPSPDDFITKVAGHEYFVLQELRVEVKHGKLEAEWADVCAETPLPECGEVKRA